MGAAGSEAEELRHCAAVSPEHKAVGNISGKPPAQEQRRKEGSCPHTASDLIELAVQIVAHGHQETSTRMFIVYITVTANTRNSLIIH